mmetsp:Transcript_1299/g.2482  ORF Transcript_1299/g.2482 Transcript_1299/m.2482 type:complete len:82 (+) Transcript_1299:82-327(+)
MFSSLPRMRLPSGYTTRSYFRSGPRFSATEEQISLGEKLKRRRENFEAFGNVAVIATAAYCVYDMLITTQIKTERNVPKKS